MKNNHIDELLFFDTDHSVGGRQHLNRKSENVDQMCNAKKCFFFFFVFTLISSGLRAQSELLNWVISLWGWRETTQIYKYKLSPVWIMLLSVSACTNTNHTAWGWSTCRCLPPTNIQIAPFCKIKELTGAGGGINILVVCVCVGAGKWVFVCLDAGCGGERSSRCLVFCPPGYAWLGYGSDKSLTVHTRASCPSTWPHRWPITVSVCCIQPRPHAANAKKKNKVKLTLMSGGQKFKGRTLHQCRCIDSGGCGNKKPNLSGRFLFNTIQLTINQTHLHTLAHTAPHLLRPTKLPHICDASLWRTLPLCCSLPCWASFNPPLQYRCVQEGACLTFCVLSGCRPCSAGTEERKPLAHRPDQERKV